MFCVVLYAFLGSLGASRCFVLWPANASGHDVKRDEYDFVLLLEIT